MLKAKRGNRVDPLVPTRNTARAANPSRVIKNASDQQDHYSFTFSPAFGARY